MKILKLQRRYKALLTFIAITMGMNFIGCEKLCGEKLKSEATSPDGRYMAAQFERNCGATTDYVAHVNLRLTSTRFKEDSSGTIKEGEVFVAEGRPQIRLAWIDSMTLVVECIGADRVFKKEDSWQNIRISYEISESKE